MEQLNTYLKGHIQSLTEELNTAYSDEKILERANLLEQVCEDFKKMVYVFSRKDLNPDLLKERSFGEKAISVFNDKTFYQVALSNCYGLSNEYIIPRIHYMIRNRAQYFLDAQSMSFPVLFITQTIKIK